jgi:hypothetical protein
MLQNKRRGNDEKMQKKGHKKAKKAQIALERQKDEKTGKMNLRSR